MESLEYFIFLREFCGFYGFCVFVVFFYGLLRLFAKPRNDGKGGKESS